MHDTSISLSVPRHARRVARASVLWLLLGAIGVGGCAKAQAVNAPVGPPLAVPAAPARVLAPVEEPTPVVAVAPEPAPTTATAPVVRPPVRRPATEAAAPAAAAAPVAAPTTLRATPTAADAAAERRVRDILTRATRDLGRVDYGRLTTGGKAQYDQARRFAEQAEQALKDVNFPFALTLADKAATLATGLQR